ncbi:MAG: tetratricopeptide repeat protein [Planctomycetia bacterium]|nr:tetratricopeptide repeat protein [Planctomycetia bacterium]
MNKYKKSRKYVFGIILISIIVISNCSQLPTLQQDNSQNMVDETESKSGGLDQINTEALEHIMDGQLYLDQGDFAMAIVELQEAQRMEPNVSSIYVLLAESYWNLNKPERSIEYLETAIEIDPKVMDAREALAEQYFRLQKFSKSERQYTILLELNPDNEDYLFALGDLAKIQRKYDQAIEYYKKAYEINNNTVLGLELAADLTHRLGKFNEADELYQILLMADSLNVNYLSAYADVNVQLNKPEKAIELVKKIITIKGSSTESLIQIGVLYSDLEKYDEAIIVFQEIFQQDSINTTGLHFLSTLHRNNKEYAIAQSYADKMILAYPDNPQGFINSALIALDQEDNEKAINILSSVAADFPEEYSIHYLLGMSFNLTKNYKMSAVYLNNARQIAPNSRNTLHLLAIVNGNLNNWTISDEIYQQLIQTDSTDAQALNNYAYSLIERGDKIELSKEYSRKAIEIAPNQAAYLDTYGWILFSLGDTKEAYKYIEKSLEIDSENVEVLEHMGDILVKMKKKTHAKEFYEKALSLDPENQQLIEKLSEF